jgi:hypothetical protein
MVLRDGWFVVRFRGDGSLDGSFLVLFCGDSSLDRSFVRQFGGMPGYLPDSSLVGSVGGVSGLLSDSSLVDAIQQCVHSATCIFSGVSVRWDPASQLSCRFHSAACPASCLTAC